MKWISVEDKFPKGGQCVLLFSKESGVAEGAYSEIDKHFRQWRWSCIKKDVTHWMPLPKSPKEN